jgi:urease
LIASQLLELMRDGIYTVAQLMDMGKQMLGRRHVMTEVLDILDEVQVEGTFPDGTYLVTVHDPICTDNGNLEMALYGTFFPIPSQDSFKLPPEKRTKRDAPGAIIALPGTIELNAGRKRISLTVSNTGDRAIQVCMLSIDCRNGREGREMEGGWGRTN